MMAAEAGFGVVPLEQVRTMDGLTLIKGLMEGRFPAPPISEVLGFDIAEAESGRVVFTYTPVFGHYNPLGSVHGGVAATLLDSVMGCCIHTTLKAGVGPARSGSKAR
ncbi:MAG TPA: PaaI family thioesterase [Reyranella sp.]